MPENKTKPTKVSVEKFIATVKPDRRREDALVLLDLMRKATRLEPVMWGPTMIGFGEYHYVYDSGHEGDSFLIGFAPRKASLVLYVMPGLRKFDPLLARLGKFKVSAGACLYINKLADVDLAVLKKLIEGSFAEAKRRKK